MLHLHSHKRVTPHSLRGLRGCRNTCGMTSQKIML